MDMDWTNIMITTKQQVIDETMQIPFSLIGVD